MLRYVAFVWNTSDPEHRDVACTLSHRIQPDRQLRTVFDVPGLKIYCSGLRAGSTECYPLQNQGGLVLGTLFNRQSDEHQTLPGKAVLDSKHSDRIIDSGGRYLIEHYWGRYAAFVRESAGGKVWVLQEPSASLPLYRSALRGVHVYFSELADCMRLMDSPPTINWDYLAAHAILPIMQTEATALNEVVELQGGECDELDGGRVLTRLYWRPARFALSRLEDPASSATALRATVKACVHAWASCYPDILHQLSGGLDSSIVLGCLRDAPTKPKVTCLTYYAHGAGADERPFARLAAQASQFELLERPVREDASFEVWRAIASSPRPSFYLACLHEREMVAIAHQVGAAVIASGNGGDAVFGEISDLRIATDYVRDHGLGTSFMQVILSTAELTQRSVGQVVWNSLRGLSRKRNIPSLAELLPYRKLLSRKVADAATDLTGHFVHPWLRGEESLPPGKMLHIDMISRPMTIRPPLSEPGDPEYVHPLTSQPIMELCLAIPTYVLTKGGRTRSIARDAFTKDVPLSLLARRTKGTPGPFVRELLDRNLPFVRERLWNGMLHKQGLLDARKLEDVLSGKPTDVDPSELLFHASTEVWLERVLTNRWRAAAA
jgi:asparagine synthase (glutamine-hydrolysing)